jgi:hypothetical protein
MQSVFALRLGASGTPAETLFGDEPTGRNFKTISLDTFVVKNGKFSSAYHVENVGRCG